ncbi:Protein MB21D2 [Labeo rohita]|uniref:Protein MB21D2 n=4 Tax=Cyprinidae TaxID=7953 RepID=A0ABQ8M0R1_LABRO|nr:Protein MB21D2 [Labeo rohita]
MSSETHLNTEPLTAIITAATPLRLRQLLLPLPAQSAPTAAPAGGGHTPALVRCASRTHALQLQYSACAPLLRFHRLLTNMAAPALSSRAGSAGSSPTATPSSTKHVPHSPELDFRSGTRIEELNRLIAEFSKHEQREYDDQRALEIHTAKDFIFSMLGEKKLCFCMHFSRTDTKQHMHDMHLKGKVRFYAFASLEVLLLLTGDFNTPESLTGACTLNHEVELRCDWGLFSSGVCWLFLPESGMVQKLDQKLPVANEYLLLSGGVREGVVDMDLDELTVYARGADYDMDFTLLVPALKLHDRNQPVTLDMRHSALCHSWLSLRLFDEGTINKWKDCCTVVDHVNGATNYFFSPTLVADWFYESISMVLAEIQKKPQRGVPRVEKVERNATVISIILGVGGSRMLYDVVPVVSFKGWPAVAQSWLMENHFWDGKITEEEVISGFYLLPACSSTGQKENEWRLSFARSEVQLKKCISASLMQAYQACKALIIKLLSRPKAISPYHLRSLMLWACDRLPHTYLAQEDYAAHFLLGLIDDLQHCLVNKTCPNYFIPQCNMLEHLSDDTAMLHARKLSSVRSDPAEHLRSAIEHAKAASRLTLELQWRGGSSNLSSPLSETGADQQPDDRLAKKLQQLVTENPGKSISVFINPDDVTRPHFRIDDKFF